MANNGMVQRTGHISTSTSMVQQGESSDSTANEHNDFKALEFKFVWPFNIPSTPEAAAVRIVRNLGHFALYYTHFVWIILFISLIPERKVSLIYLVIMTYVASLYLLTLRALPNCYVLHKVIDKHVVLGLLVIVTMVELILTNATIHLLATLAAAIPIILVHAVLWVREDLFIDDKTSTARELIPLVHETTSMV